ncbi:hypothetical protein FA13DRAFT_1015914 [Coprinellus micaceus]|uniref:Uncharacterized protein n=1 Tax=Coprinellus micaceus TaxID=71717 RepID=A0A4Y7RP87_COPMI|nr:hypothetical protein FA13DRAFT_1015914 [Coprinellus micaceus]
MIVEHEKRTICVPYALLRILSARLFANSSPRCTSGSHRLRFGWVILWFHPYWEDSSGMHLPTWIRNGGFHSKPALERGRQVKRFVDSQ